MGRVKTDWTNCSFGSGIALLRSPNDILIDSQFRNNKTDPSMPPEREPGDAWIVMGMLLGAVAMGLGGFVISFRTGAFNPFLGLAGGAILGGLIGTFLGDLIKKRIRRRGHRRK